MSGIKIAKTAIKLFKNKRGFIVMSFFKLFSDLLFILSTLILSNFLDENDFSVYSYLYSLITLFSIISLYGIHLNLLRNIPNVSDSTVEKELVSNSLFLVLVISIISSTLLFFYLLYSFKDYNILVGFLIPLSVFSFSINQLSVYFLQSKKMFFASIFMDKFLISISILFSVIYHWLFNKEINFLIILTIPIIIISILNLFILNKAFSFVSIRFNYLRSLFKECFYYSLQGLISTLNKNLPIILLGIYSLKLVGSLSVALKLMVGGSIIQALVDSFSSPFFTKYFSERKTLKIRDLYVKLQFLMFLFCVLYAALMILFGKYILSFFGNINHEITYLVLVILTIRNLFLQSFGPTGITLLMTGNEKKEFHSHFIELTVILISFFILAEFANELESYIYIVSISCMVSKLCMNLYRYNFVRNLFLLDKK